MTIKKLQPTIQVFGYFSIRTQASNYYDLRPDKEIPGKAKHAKKNLLS